MDILRTSNNIASGVVYNLPPLVLSRLGTLVALPFALFIGLGVPEQALGGIPLHFGIVMEDKPSELSCNFVVVLTVIFLLILVLFFVIYVKRQGPSPSTFLTLAFMFLVSAEVTRTYTTELTRKDGQIKVARKAPQKNRLKAP